MFKRKNKKSTDEQSYFDSDAIYRQQSIYSQPSNYLSPNGNADEIGNSGYIPPNIYQPPVLSSVERPADVGYRPPLFPGSAELAEIIPEPMKEEPKTISTSVVLSKSLQSIAKSLKKVQERAKRSHIQSKDETEEERSIKALFSDRIVKGRPDLFVPATPIPISSPSADVSPSTRSGIIQGNLAGFFSQFAKQQGDNDEASAGKWAERQRDFNKRFGRSDAQYLRTAVNTFCEETKRMYSYLLSQEEADDEEDVLQGITPMSPMASTPQTEARQRQQPIEDRIHSFTDALTAEMRKHKAWRGVDDEGMRVTRDCVEKLLVETLRGYTLGFIRVDMKKEDDDLEKKMEDLQFLTMQNLDVSPICQENGVAMHEVLKKLQQIQDVSSPAEKLECIIESCRILGSLLQSGNKSGNDAGADDFLPAFIYTVLKSGLQKLPSTVEFISRFRHPDELLSEGGYCLTNLSGAVSFLQNCGGCDFDIDPDEFERNYHKTVPVPAVVEEEEEEDLLCF